MADYSSMSPDERRRACAAWYLLAGHRALWNLPLFGAITVFIVLMLLRGTGEDPEINLRQSSAAITALQPAPIKDDDNAALDYQAGFALTFPFKGKSENDPHQNISKPTDKFESAEVLDYLDGHDAAAQRFQDGAQKVQCNWKLSYNAGAGLPLPHLSNCRNAARILAARARVSAHKGDHKAAAAELDTIYKMSKHTDVDKVLISSLVAVAMNNFADVTIENIVLYDTPVKVEDIAAYRKILERERDPVARIIRALETEKIFMIYSIDLEMTRLATGPTSMMAGFGIPTLPGGAMPWYGADRKCFVDSIDEIIANTRRRDFNANADINKLIARHQQGPAILTSMILPAVSRLQDNFITTAEKALLIDTGLAFMQYRAKHGRDAKSLDELVPEFLSEVRKGIFHEQPLRMRVDPNGIVFRPIYDQITRKSEPLTIHPGVIRIYSVGKNGIDEQGSGFDSGEQFPIIEGPNKDDVSFRIPPAQPLAPPIKKEVTAP